MSQRINLGGTATGPLTGVKVIDFTAVYSGPIAASILGDQGAEVIKDGEGVDNRPATHVTRNLHVALSDHATSRCCLNAHVPLLLKLRFKIL